MNRYIYIVICVFFQQNLLIAETPVFIGVSSVLALVSG